MLFPSQGDRVRVHVRDDVETLYRGRKRNLSFEGQSHPFGSDPWSKEMPSCKSYTSKLTLQNKNLKLLLNRQLSISILCNLTGLRKQAIAFSDRKPSLRQVETACFRSPGESSTLPAALFS